MRLKFSRLAEEGVISIWRKGARTVGADQAERYHTKMAQAFEIIAANPKIAREREEISPLVRVHPYGAHLIVYEIDETTVFILRVRQHCEDWIRACLKLFRRSRN
jgi:toxin ParE1/3/4